MLVSSMKNSIIKNSERGRKTPEDSVGVHVVSGIESKSENIYYNVSIINKVVTDPLGVLPSISVPKIANFKVNRADAILSVPSNYRVAVSRFGIPSSSIPLFLFPTNPSFFTVTLTYDSDPLNPLNVVNQYTRNVTYVPSSVGDQYEAYQPVYFINEVLQYVNIALQQAFDDAVADLGDLVYLPKERPYLTFDSTTQLITMWCETEFLDFGQFGIFFNTTLYQTFFNGLYAREAATNKLTGFNGYQIIPQNLFTNIDENTNLPPPNAGVPIDLYKVIEEESSVPSFNQLDRVVLVSHTLPISGQLIATQRDVTARILHDHILEDTAKNNQKIEYQPRIYRWCDLHSHTPLTEIDLEVFIVYKTGEILPLYINASSRVDVQLLFVPKTSIYE